MFNSTYPFGWVYYLPKPFQKVFEAFWERFFCSRDMHLYDYVFDGHSSLVCDVCQTEVYIIEPRPKEKLKGKMVGIYPDDLIFDHMSIKKVKDQDPDALVLDIEMNNRLSDLLLKSVCLYLINVDKPLDYENLKLALANYLNLLTNITNFNETIRSNQNLIGTFRLSYMFDKNSIRIRSINELDDDTIYYNSEMVILSHKLKGAWIE